MLKTKIVSTVLASLMVIGVTSVNTFAAEIEDLNTSPVSLVSFEEENPIVHSIMFNKEAKSHELSVLGEKLKNAKSAMEGKLFESQKTEEERAAIKAQMSEKFANMKIAKKESRGSKLEIAQGKGISKGMSKQDYIV